MIQQTSLQQLHTQFQTPRELIFDLVQKATGKSPTDLTKIIKGYDSEVYSIKTESGERYIAKIRHYGEVSYEEEEWAIDLCSKEGVPVPTILLRDTIDIKGKEHEVMVQEELSGKPLAEVRSNLSEHEMNTVLENAGAILSKIHSIHVSGFYHWDQNDNWDFKTWKDLTDSLIKSRRSEKSLILKAGITETEFKRAMQAMVEYQTDFSCEQPVFCHGDYLPEHIFVDDDLNITGILDFGMYEGSHPIHDFAFISFEAPGINLDAIKSGYTNKGLFEDRFDRRLLLHKIALQLGHLAHAVIENMMPEMKFDLMRLKDSLDQL